MEEKSEENADEKEGKRKMRKGERPPVFCM